MVTDAEPTILRFIHHGHGITVRQDGEYWTGKVYGASDLEVSEFVYEFQEGKFPGLFTGADDVPERDELIRVTYLRIWKLSKGRNPHCPTVEAMAGGLRFTFTQWQQGLPWAARTADGSPLHYHHAPNPLHSYVQTQALDAASRTRLALRLWDQVQALTHSA